MDKRVYIPFETKSLDEGGSFEGYASVFGVQDFDGDVIVRGAFRKSLQRSRESGRMPKMLWQHNPSQIIGKWYEMTEDDKGLWVKGSLILDVEQAREAYALLKASVLDGMSIGFNITEGQRGAGGRVIEEVDLMEVSLVTWGANPDALVTRVKARNSVRDFEAFLRDAGFSRKEAKAITAEGFRAIEDQRDVGGDGAEWDDLMSSIRSTIKTMRN